MEITQHLIRKFFENKCDPDEFDAVMNYLQDHPEQAERHLGIKEWNEIDPLAPIPDNHQAEMLKQLKEQLFRQLAPSVIHRLPRKTNRFSRIAIAASLLLATAGLLWIRTKNSTAGDTNHSLVQQAGNKRGLLPHAWISRANHSGKPLIIQLPDGSSVKLYDHSTLRYTDSFGTTQRNSWLEGEAVFTVAKNRDKPFTVFSGALATTALGTSFSAKSPVTTGAVTVKLYTGRVVVRSTHVLSGWNKDIYLSPGQQVLYDDHRMLATVSRFVIPEARPAGKEEGKEEQDLVFNNSSLKEVMDRLSVKYNRKIVYRAEDIAGMNFTGTVAPSDTLASFLKLLAAMNNLDIQENEPVFIVTKRPD
ncbi:MAG TPA: FecR domain-containing protein [Puia sp.]